MPWDPGRYEQFRDERYAPFADLVSMIDVRPGLRVIDLGCGTGELTAKLVDLLPESDVLGIDASAEMLAKAAAFARPSLRFEQRTIEAALEANVEFDLVFSHAALQWVDDHDALIPRLVQLIAAGGQIVVQVPSNHRHPSHRLIVETACEEPFCSGLGGWTRSAPVLAIDAYASLLHRAGAGQIAVFEKVYGHTLHSADAMVDWVRGTALVPYMERLPIDLRDAFIESYRAKLRSRFPQTPLYYPFRRTLFSARRPGRGTEAGSN